MSNFIIKYIVNPLLGLALISLWLGMGILTVYYGIIFGLKHPMVYVVVIPFSLLYLGATLGFGSVIIAECIDELRCWISQSRKQS